MASFLHRKNIVISVDRYLIKALGSMALGLFASLIIGLIMKVMGEKLGVSFLVDAGSTAMDLMGPAIGVAVAYGLQAPPLVMFASVVTGAAGASLGGPAGSFVSAVIGVELGKLVSKETPLDIIVTPVTTILAGFAAASTVGPAIDAGMKSLGDLIVWATELQPIPMGILVAVLMGLALTAPISSAALGIMMGLDGLAAGAAAAGCAAQMIGFATISYRENGIGGLLAQGLGTSMLQISNIVRNPWILLPPTLAGAAAGPIATTVFQLKNIPIGSGMGTAGLVGQFGTVTAMGFTASVFWKIIILHFIVPSVIAGIAAAVLWKLKKIEQGDLKLDL
ncbi:MAG: PTS sugar transporter subunit IIC [Clostridiales bacterium]|nr:PTS sugar transporter subunit IIC [Clostridiales bacterium]MCF8022964.1 PTS sugar transporter subunit IIC [Clostridiales bacterium]